MSSVAKGDQLEESFYRYLCGQKDRGELLYGIHVPSICEIFPKKKYYCGKREDDVEFDIVIEISRKGESSPHSYLVFECKNYTKSVPETEVTHFSSKLSSVFGHAAKGVLVFSNKLQSGAERFAKNNGIGLAKFDENGLEIKANRMEGPSSEDSFVRRQFFRDMSAPKSLMFSAYYDGKYYGSVAQIVNGIVTNPSPNGGAHFGPIEPRLAFLTVEAAHRKVRLLLESIDYIDGPVKLDYLCADLKISISRTDETTLDSSGESILGTANFDLRQIKLHFHENKQRERFTLAHEIGHIHLGHGEYLRSETFIERDMFEVEPTRREFYYQRLEYQANLFASFLLLPETAFNSKVLSLRDNLGFQDRGNGMIYVDDQPCNLSPFTEFVHTLAMHFDVSVKVVEIRLKGMGVLNDQRRHGR